MYAPSVTTNYKPSLAVRAAAELERRRRGKRLDFGEWLPAVTPAYVWGWRHLVHIRAQIDRVSRGEIDRLILTVPPRHGKSSMVTVRYPAWLLERDPTRRVIVGCYNQTLAEKFSRQTRRIARERIALNDERTAVNDWETAAGGGLRAVGVGAGITGVGGDCIIIDDPTKSRAEANSLAYRDRVWDWYTDDLYTRLEPGGKLIVIATRWHEDDLIGRLLTSEDADAWQVVNLPALAEEGDPLGRQAGQALCPERYDEAALGRIKAVLGNSFYALYQQRPTAPEGDFFRRSWFEIVPAAPADCVWVRWWDKAGSADASADYTAGVLVGRSSAGLYYVADVVRGQWTAMERERVIRQTAEIDQHKYGPVTYWHEQEPGSGGKDSAAATTRTLAGFAVHSETSTGDKRVRAEPLAAQAEAGNVKIVRGAWNAGYLSELTSFPQGGNDDQVDGSSGAFNKLARGVRREARSYKG